MKQMLLLEYKVYQEMEGERGFPLAIEYEEEETFSYMAMERLETTLDVNESLDRNTRLKYFGISSCQRTCCCW